jgi:CheY-like chemotaxis protein
MRSGTHDLGSCRYVLVVDDDPTARKQATQIIEGYGLLVRAVATKAEGLALLRSANPPAAIVTDEKLLDGWGSELIFEHRKEGGKTPALIMSGYLANQLRQWRNTSLVRLRSTLPDGDCRSLWATTTRDRRRLRRFAGSLVDVRGRVPFREYGTVRASCGAGGHS